MGPQELEAGERRTSRNMRGPIAQVPFFEPILFMVSAFAHIHLCYRYELNALRFSSHTE